jgi:hypothetical protein
MRKKPKDGYPINTQRGWGWVLNSDKNLEECDATKV